MGKMFWFVLTSIFGLASIVLSIGIQDEKQVSLVTLGTSPTVWAYDGATHRLSERWKAIQPNFTDQDIRAVSRERTRFIGGYKSTHIGDCNGDGINDLILADAYGIIVYGLSPAYYPFSETASPTLGRVYVLVSDFDKDGTFEFVTNTMDASTSRPQHRIEIWKASNNKLEQVWGKTLSGISFTLLLADADDDGKQELITASDTIVIMKQSARMDWEIAAELPNIGHPRQLNDGAVRTQIDVVRVADIDGDGKNEILATGNSGMLTIYKHCKQPSGRESYPVLWQSPWLVNNKLQPSTGASRVEPFTQGLGIGDLNGDQRPEILVGTVSNGNRPDGAAGINSNIYIFSFDGQRGFAERWVSDYVFRANIPAFSIGDLDGDGLNEFSYNGQSIYGYNPATSTYEIELDLGSPKSTDIGSLGALREPADAIRIIPVAWTLPQGRMVLGETSEVSVSLGSVWATAKDVVMDVKSDSPNLIVKNGTVRIGEIPGGQIVASPTFTVEAPKAAAQPANEDAPPPSGNLVLTITAAGGYRQTIPLRVTIAAK